MLEFKKILYKNIRYVASVLKWFVVNVSECVADVISLFVSSISMRTIHWVSITVIDSLI